MIQARAERESYEPVAGPGEVEHSGLSGRVLVVDDDPAVTRTITRILASEWEIVTVADGLRGIEVFLQQEFDALVTDIAMPRMDGLELSERVKRVSKDVPVILMTGSPSVESAVEAIELQIFRYLPKPFDASTLKDAVGEAVRHGRMARMRREALEVARSSTSDTAALREDVERALASLWLAYQPIIDRTSRVVGYEALMRHDEGTFDDPVALLAAAEELGLAERLCAQIRGLAPTPRVLRSDMLLFVNVDPRHLACVEGEDMGDPLTSISERVVLELTEHISLNGVAHAEEKIKELKSAGYRLAVDDLGSGYSGLSSFAQIGPDFVKLDRTLVDSVARDRDKQRVVGGISRLCHDLGITVIAEGIERREDLEALTVLECDLFQGYLIGKPEPFA